MTIKVGVIGCGYWGPNLIRNFVELPESEVVAVADLQRDRLKHIQSRYPQIQVATRDYTNLFQLDLDAIVIATPPHTHFRLARECLEKGHHVLVEKPLTTRSQDARELLLLARQKSRVLMVGHTFEYNPAVHVLKEMVASGEIGRVHYIDAVWASLGLFQTKVNVVWDLAPHAVSILRFVLGQEPLQVSTWGSGCVQEGIADVAYLTLVFPDDLLAHVRLSWLDPCKTRRVTVVGSKKMVIYDDVESLEKIKVYDKGVKAIRRTDTFGEFQFAYHYGDVVIPYIHFEEPLRVQCQHFLTCVQEGKEPQTGAFNGLRVVEIVEAAQESLAQNGKVIPVASSLYPVVGNGRFQQGALNV
ncbi:MAG: gfo/Idh/MocA family oxidoreductase [Chloroflexi bacterium]|nr:MAG: gfo/Idh/MocA family oxidoreductase [Chloroflexota bacterium]